MDEFTSDFKRKLINHLKLEDVDPDELGCESTLFGEGSGLELDSIDAIELEVFLKSEYGLDVHPSERTESVFGTIGALAAFAKSNLNRDA